MKRETLIDRLLHIPEQDIARVIGMHDEVGRTYSLCVSALDEERFVHFGRFGIVTSSAEYGIIHIPKNLKSFVPGYRRQFVLHTDVQPFIMHVTGRNGDLAVGDEGGSYLCHPRPSDVDAKWLEFTSDARSSRDGSFKRFYEAHPELESGSRVCIFRADPEHYVLRPF